MNELVGKFIVAGASAVVSALIAVFELIKNKMTEKQRRRAEDIARVVEQIYDGCPSGVKQAAFVDLCKRAKINHKKALEYLETVLIPISKVLNVAPERNAAERGEEAVD